MVRLTFINSLPESVSVELQQLDGVATMSVSDLLKRARIFTENVTTRFPTSFRAKYTVFDLSSPIGNCDFFSSGYLSG